MHDNNNYSSSRRIKCAAMEAVAVQRRSRTYQYPDRSIIQLCLVVGPAVRSSVRDNIGHVVFNDDNKTIVRIRVERQKCLIIFWW